MQVMLLHLFATMNQTEGITAQLRHLSETSGAIDSLSPEYASFVKDAMGVYPPLVELERRELLGESVKSELADAQETLRKFQLKYFQATINFKRSSHRRNSLGIRFLPCSGTPLMGCTVRH